MVGETSRRMPRIGTRKLYYLLQDRLKEMNIGRDTLFNIMSAKYLEIMQQIIKLYATQLVTP